MEPWTPKRSRKEPTHNHGTEAGGDAESRKIWCDLDHEKPERHAVWKPDDANYRKETEWRAVQKPDETDYQQKVRKHTYQGTHNETSEVQTKGGG